MHNKIFIKNSLRKLGTGLRLPCNLKKKIASNPFLSNSPKILQQLCRCICFLSLLCLSPKPFSLFLSLGKCFSFMLLSHCSPLIFFYIYSSLSMSHFYVSTLAHIHHHTIPWPRDAHKRFFHLRKHGKGYCDCLRFNICF